MTLLQSKALVLARKKEWSKPPVVWAHNELPVTIPIRHDPPPIVSAWLAGRYAGVVINPRYYGVLRINAA